MDDMKTKLKNFLSKDEATTADDFYDDMYFGRFDLGNNIPCYIDKDPEVDKAWNIAFKALIEKVGKKEASRIDNLITASEVRTHEKEYRWFFKQGLKAGYAIHEMIHELEE